MTRPAAAPASTPAPPTNDRRWVLERLAGFGRRVAVIADGRTVTYDDLIHGVAGWRANLDSRRQRQSVVVVTGDFSAPTVSAVLACWLEGAVIVPVHTAAADRGDDVAALVGADITIHAGRGGVRELPPAGERHPLIRQLFATGEAGLVLLSSGSTGAPKAMLLSLDRLVERHRVRSTFKPMTTAAFLLFDHIGGFNTLMHCLLTGGTLVHLASRDAAGVCRAIEHHGIQLLPVTPTFLNMLLINGLSAGADLSSLKLITYGTEVMPPSTLAALAAALPGVTFKQTYGLSEAGILGTKSRANDSVWMKIDAGMKVLDGILWVKSPTAMLGYLNAPSPFDADGWLCTGDVVDVDGEYVRVRGRREQIINVGGLKVFPAEVEDRLRRAPGVADAAVWGRKNPVTGFVVAASIVRRSDTDEADARREIVDYCRRHMDEHKVPRFIEFVEGPLHTERFKKAARR